MRINLTKLDVDYSSGSFYYYRTLELVIHMYMYTKTCIKLFLLPVNPKKYIILVINQSLNLTKEKYIIVICSIRLDKLIVFNRYGQRKKQL